MLYDEYESQIQLLTNELLNVSGSIQLLNIPL